jgi:hypothetical protein
VERKVVSAGRYSIAIEYYVSSRIRSSFFRYDTYCHSKTPDIYGIAPRHSKYDLRRPTNIRHHAIDVLRVIEPRLAEVTK